MKVEHENFQFLIWVCENPLVTERVDSGISYGGLEVNWLQQMKKWKFGDHKMHQLLKGFALQWIHCNPDPQSLLN